MRLDQIAAVILTRDEAPNIARTLEKLRWARQIVVVDSQSADDTVAIAGGFPNVRVVTRAFRSHADQWSFAVFDTGIDAEWILALDADYVLSDDLVEELRTLEPASGVDGYSARFIYCVDGRPLRATLYPPVTVLYRKAHARYWQDGHTQRVSVDGAVRALRGPIFHDDRKSLSSWVAAQDRYARIEAEKLSRPSTAAADWPERLRRTKVLAPFAMLAYCLFVKGLVLDGWPGVFYAFQRTFAELLLSLHLIRRALDRRAPHRDGP
jgi:glycosyltransferase involved in cell wall biosynthesis